MKNRSFFLFLTILPIKLLSLDFQPSSKAEELFQAGLYHHAITEFQRCETTDPFTQAIANLKLMECHFKLQDYDKVIKTGKKTTNYPSQDLENQRQILISQAFIALKKYSLAIQALTPILSSSSDETLQKVLFFLGTSYFFSERLEKAEDLFSKVIENNIPPWSLKARCYASRIALNRGENKEAISILDSIEFNDNDQRYEKSYLKGNALFAQKLYLSAAKEFEKTIPSTKTPWYQEALHQLSRSYLCYAMESSNQDNETQKAFESAEQALEKLTELSSEEVKFLELAQAYLWHYQATNNPVPLEKAKKLLSSNYHFKTREGQLHSLLLQAEATHDFEAKQKIFRQITHDSNSHTSFYTKGWIAKGSSELHQATKLQSVGNIDEATSLFLEAAFSFGKVAELEPKSKETEFKCKQVQALMATESLQGFRQAYEILKQQPANEEILYLYALTSTKLWELQEIDTYKEDALTSINQLLTSSTSELTLSRSQLLKGKIELLSEQFEQAEKTFLKTSVDSTTEGLFWAATAADSLANGKGRAKRYRSELLQSFPNHPLAPEAHYRLFSLGEYMQGDRSAIKHLEVFPTIYPNSPLVMNALYLLGLDYKRNRKTEEGKWIRKKNLLTAIDYFQKAEEAFTHIKKHQDYHLHLRYNSMLEKALANYTIAKESEGAKAQIFLEYTTETLKEIIGETSVGKTEPPGTHITCALFPYVEEEATFWLGKVLAESQRENEAEQIFNALFSRYQQAKISKGYFLSKMWFERGMMALKNQENILAMKAFEHAEETGKGNILSTDEKLDLWIQQAKCQKQMNQIDQTILILTRVINANAVSSLRLKAMYLRAEAYEAQNRRELARNQLKALIQKSGEWALKAKQKLEKDYGF